MKTIVISAVNLRKGGTLTILRNCLEYLSSLDASKFRIIALVHRKELAMYPNIEYVEIPWAMKNWVFRLWCEYVTMKKISKRISPVYLWLSLHDTTPNVNAERRIVYCHNPFPFFEWRWKQLYFNYHIVCFAWFSKYIYWKNIHKNKYVIVQQEWIREKFIEMFSINKNRIIIALPSCSSDPIEKKVNKDRQLYRFIFASFPDIHKNFETLCRAVELLEKEIGKDKFKVSITISGNENRYARYLKRHWGGISSIEFTGFMKKDKLYEYYREADCLVFPSKVETWGLPISEFAVSGKPMLLADLPYAHETAAGSKRTAFFNPFDPHDLKDKMLRLIKGDSSFLLKIDQKEISAPIANTWAELFKILLN
jgi:glycosyltransferase involved in cell wall biosynthesis